MGNLQTFGNFLLVTLFSSCLLFQTDDAKTSRVRTNYKLRVGQKQIGRYTPYSQVRLPPTDKYATDDADKYYRHAKVSTNASKSRDAGSALISCLKHGQWWSVERSIPIPEVRGSNPVIGKKIYCTFTVNCTEKTKIKKKRPGMAHF